MRVAQVLFQGIRWCVEATDRLVFLSRKLSYCSFSCFEGEIGLLNCISRMELGTIVDEACEKFASLQTDSGLQLGLEIAFSGVSAKTPAPRNFSVRPKMR